MKLPEVLEKEFDIFFSKIGYQRVTDIIGQSAPFKNADYIARATQTIVELKILDKDFFYKGGIIHRLNATVVVPHNVDAYGYGQYNFSLPAKNREGYHDTFEEPLRRIIKKANRQLRETKNYFFDGTGNGIIMFAINGFVSLNPQIVARMICELLGNELSSVSGFLLCIPTRGIFNSDTKMFHPECIVRTPFGCTDELNALCINIGKCWGEFVNAGGHLDAQ